MTYVMTTTICNSPQLLLLESFSFSVLTFGQLTLSCCFAIPLSFSTTTVPPCRQCPDYGQLQQGRPATRTRLNFATVMRCFYQLQTPWTGFQFAFPTNATPVLTIEK